MLSLISCRSIKKKVQTSLIGDRSTLNKDKAQDRQQQQQPTSRGKNSVSSNPFDEVSRPKLFICLIALLFALIQCSSTKHLKYESKEGKPCICNQTFYQKCPKASECTENKLPSTHKPMTLEDFEHDNLDPDHVDKADYDYAFDNYDSDYLASINKETWGHPWPPPGINTDTYEDRITKHRKVYVTERKDNLKSETIIHPLKITIPVRIPEIKEENIPEPSPMFKMRKYVSYETRPEIQMVPVTKTIIKPANVDPSQIINYDSSQGLP